MIIVIALLKSSKAKNIRNVLVDFIGATLTGVSVSGDFEFAIGWRLSKSQFIYMFLKRRATIFYHLFE